MCIGKIRGPKRHIDKRAVFAGSVSVVLNLQADAAKKAYPVFIKALTIRLQDAGNGSDIVLFRIHAK